MKSIFRKIAFVLALAMVVTMFPVMNASAANNGNKYVRSKNATLYVGGDANGDYESCWAASAKGKKLKTEEKYKIEYVSSNPDVATVSKYGLVEAKSVGSTKIIVTFTKKGETTIEESFDVTVKKNAANIALDKESQDALAAGLTVGDAPIMLKAVQTDAEGSSEGITDTVKFYCGSKEDKEIIQLDSKTGELTALMEGKATVVVQSCQYEYDRETKKYKTTVAKEERYDVKVEKAKISGRQSAYNAFVLTFPSPEDAKAALEETKKSLTNAGAAVSEAKNIIKVYKVLANSNNARREVFIGNLSYDGAEGVTSSINVTMFDELDEKTNYVISYKDHDEVTITTTTYIADGLELDGRRTVDGTDIAEDYSVVEVCAKLYTAEGVLIGDSRDGSCNKYRGWENSLMLEDTNTALIHNEYQFDPSTRRVWFYTSDRNYKVTLRGTYEDWVNITAGNPKVIQKLGVITPADNNIYVNESFDWCIVPNTSKNRWNANWNNKTFASEDSGYHLLVKANITEIGANPEDKYNESYSASDYFTFVSANDDRLAVNYETGELYPPKTATNDVIGIHVYYKGRYVNTCRVEIISRRTLVSLTAQGSTTKLAHSTKAVNTDINEDFIIALYPKDQLGEQFVSGVVPTVEVSDNNLKQYFENNGVATQIGNTWDGYPQFKLEVKDGLRLTQIMNVRLICKATYWDGAKTVVKQYPVSFSLKDTTDSSSTSYRLEQNKSSVDMKVESRNNGTSNNIGEKDVSITAYGYDKDGYKVEKLYIDGTTPNADGSIYKVAVTYGSYDLDTQYTNFDYRSHKSGSGKDVTIKPVMAKTVGSYWTVSGSGVALANVTRSAIEKMPTGNYVVALYKGSNLLQNSRLLSLSDSQTLPSMTWTGVTTEEFNPLEVIRKAVRVTAPNGWQNITDSVYYDGSANTTDIRINGQNLYIERLRWAEQIGQDWLEYYIPVRRSVTFGTNIYN